MSGPDPAVVDLVSDEEEDNNPAKKVKKSESDDEVGPASPTVLSLPMLPVDVNPMDFRPFVCVYCNGRFISAIMFKKHMAEHEHIRKKKSGVPDFECLICTRQFLYYPSRAFHCITRHPDKHIPPPKQPTPEELASERAKAISVKEMPDGPPLRSAKKSSSRIPYKPSDHDYCSKKRKREKQSKDKAKKKGSPSKKRDEKRHKKRDKKKDKKSEATAKEPDKKPIPDGIPVKVPTAVNNRPPEEDLDYTVFLADERTCRICLKSFRAGEFWHHTPCYLWSKFHVDTGFKCNLCNDSSVVYRNVKELGRHGLEHFPPAFSCNYCSLKFFHLYEIEHHVVERHGRKLRAGSSKD